MALLLVCLFFLDADLKNRNEN